jgi:phospholipid/cholesterol/gamma-HCH transport system permease protein
MNFLSAIGKYALFILRVFSKPEKWKILYTRTIYEIEKLGINSIGIVVIISVFMGAVITLQTAYNTTSPLLPPYIIGLAARDSIILEFSSTIVALILSGKVGSNIASEIGTMRITEQIDALEIMGVNSAGFLVLPKIVATVFFFPILTVLSIFIGIFGGWLVGEFTGAITSMQYIRGIQWGFEPFYVTYSLIKSVVFAFIITSVSAFHGYNVKGGSLEVGRASTTAVVVSSILVLLFNLIITQLLLK